MKKSILLGITWLCFNFFLSSCTDSHPTNGYYSQEKVVTEIKDNGWLSWTMITLEDNTIQQCAPGWVQDMNLKVGDRMLVMVNPHEFPNKLILKVRKVEPIVSEKDTLGYRASYEDEKGFQMKVKNFRTRAEAEKAEFHMMRGEHGYYDAQPQVEVGFPAQKPILKDRLPK